MPDTTPNPDWDGLFTFALAILVSLLTCGTAYLFWMRQVVTLARAKDIPRTEDAWLVVPGKRLTNDRPDADFRQRLARAWEGAAPPFKGRIVILGGITAGSTISEAEAGLRFLQSLPGGATTPVLLEAKSDNTLTNLRNLRDLVARSGAAAPTLTLISSRYHLARIGLIASSLGIPYRLVGAEHWFRLTPATLLELARESFFCLWFVVGRGWARLTRNRRMLERIT